MAKDTSNWLKSAVIYEIFTRNHSKEGNIESLVNDLERIKDIGVDIIWLMPIHPIGSLGRKGSAGCPYSIKDYTKINKELGNKEDLKFFISEAHRLNLKVIIDVVYNHTSNDSVLINEYPDWFLKSKGMQRKIDDWEDVSDLDYSDRGLWDYLIKALEKWVGIGVDGFRCDVASLVPIEFWLEAKNYLDKKKDIIWLAESVELSFIKHIRERGFIGHSDPEIHQVFDISYDYDGYSYLKPYLHGFSPIADYVEYLYLQECLYPINYSKLRFIENHDIKRIASITNVDRLKNLTVFYNLIPGAPLIYAGQEYAINHSPNLFEIDPINWEEGDKYFYEYFKKVVKLGKEIKQSCNYFSISEIFRCKGAYEIKWHSHPDEDESDILYVSIINLENEDFTNGFKQRFPGTNLINDVNIDKIISLNELPAIVRVK